MTSLDFTPKPGSAPAPRRVLAQAAMELKLSLRNGEQLLLTFVIPVLLLIVGSKSSRLIDSAEPLTILTPGVFALAILSSSFTSVAIASGFERRYGVLKRLGATPLSPIGLLGGKVLAVAAVQLLQLAVLAAIAFALGWRPNVGASAWLWLLALAALATCAFGALALLMAGTLRAEVTLALANLIYVLLLVGGGVLLPLSRYREEVATVLQLLPAGALGEGLREVFVTGSPSTVVVAVLAGWAIVASAAARKWFKWE